MSDLQIGLLILGLFIVGCVIAFNWIQERQFHQRSEQGFNRPSADLLLDPKTNQRTSEELEERIDPSFEPQFEENRATADRAEQQAAQPVDTGSDDSVVDDSIGYVAEIRSGEVIPAATISGLTQTLTGIERKTQLFGYDHHTRKWAPVFDPDHEYTAIRVFVQLVDRTGAVTREEQRALPLVPDRRALFRLRRATGPMPYPPLQSCPTLIMRCPMLPHWMNSASMSTLLSD